MAAKSVNHNAERERPFRFDPDDPDYIKDLQRPAVIKEDLTEMERRKRVQQLLESKSFCKELEEVIRQESESNRSDSEHLKTIQRLSELTLPSSAMSFASLHSLGGSAIPIADLKGKDNYTKQEKLLRNKLASLFRLVDLFQWSQGIHNHITLRLSGDDNHILVNPFGLLYHEVTAGSLVKVDLQGEILDGGATKLGINRNAFMLHSAIHSTRPDVRCILHMHTAVVSAVASMKCGLLPLCHEAIVIGPVAYHDYQGSLSEEESRDSLVKSLGDKNILIWRGDGCLVVGETLEEAVLLMRNLVSACDHQIRAARAGIDNLVIPDEKAIERAYNFARSTGNGSGASCSPGRNQTGSVINWRVGELEWEAWMRVLDHAGFRTGHIYRQPFLRPKSTTAHSTVNNNDVAVPPSVSATGLVDESDAEAVAAHKLALLRKEQERNRWLNSPNAYQKVEILETGTDNPKKITKWVQDATSPSASGTPVKISIPHHFSPLSSNPKEFKDKQRAIKESGRLGTTTAGPQSQILDGVTYEDVARMRPDVDGIVGQTDRTVLIGTASKGIIDRQHQHNAQVYRQLYAPNPFACETDEDIKKYIEEVELKSPKSRTPCSTARDKSLERSERTSSPFEEDPGADTASLMQAARVHRTTNNAMASVSSEALDLLPDVSANTEKAMTNVKNVDDLPRKFSQGNSPTIDVDYFQWFSWRRDVPNFFRRTKSERFSSTLPFVSGNSSARSNATLSEDEASSKSERKKKKRKSLFSFMKKKDKSASS
ncbi:Class II Aldolase and Adducin N-terminal domain [Parelaphostrongylus tenuis]|uniref:Class II Aldolase and Adducin N-terminal domain n=1 Tax=Parelaphostrongylus tenuis TaxID=148309 RepID=A0AAD5NA97_PARTN|nr:Class II Aldolase and Adducin N-terminal domain [Parelaphostrongylus tenuis]